MCVVCYIISDAFLRSDVGLLFFTFFGYLFSFFLAYISMSFENEIVGFFFLPSSSPSCDVFLLNVYISWCYKLYTYVLCCIFQTIYIKIDLLLFAAFDELTHFFLSSSLFPLLCTSYITTWSIFFWFVLLSFVYLKIEVINEIEMCVHIRKKTIQYLEYEYRHSLTYCFYICFLIESFVHLENKRTNKVSHPSA